MAQPAGAVYHPEYGNAIAADAVKRWDLIRKLKVLAEDSNTKGDALLPGGDYHGANEFWKYAARCMRSSQALAASKPVDPQDYPIVGRAWLQVQHGSQFERDVVERCMAQVVGGVR